MKPKNLMLLGFVNKAVDYLDKNADDKTRASLADLKENDLLALKKSMGYDLDESLGDAQSTVESLLHAGGEVFDSFIDEEELRAPEKKMSLSDELSQMMDVDFDAMTPDEEKAELNKLLDFYSLDSVLDDEEIEQFTSDVKDDAKSDDKETDDPISKEIVDNDDRELDIETADENKTEENIEPDHSDFELSDEESALMNTIAQNVNISSEGKEIPNDTKEQRDLDSIFSEVMSGKVDEPETVEPIPEEKKEVPAKKKDTLEIPGFMPYRIIENPLVDDIEVEGETSKESKAESNEKESKAESSEKTDYNVENNIEVTEDIFPKKKKAEHLDTGSDKKKEESQLPTIDKAQVDDLYKEIRSKYDTLYEDLEDVYKADEEEDDRYTAGLGEESPHKVYVSSLIDDLKNQLNVEEERKKEEEEEFKEVFDRVHRIYPYLSVNFIKNVYDIKDSIDEEYPEKIKIVILHRTLFKDVENLRQFVEIALNHGYQLNADEQKMIVDVFKEYTNAQGRIVTSIFEVANQSSLLNGEYDGYRVLLPEDLGMRG